MTTLAMIFGMLPTALGYGSGAEVRSPMAITVIGGLITSTLLTLLVVPVVYTLIDDLGRRFFHKGGPSDPLDGHKVVVARELTAVEDGRR
jgi:HAE1 family hydrophobic/amphiphilic exporter-1